MAGTRPKSDSCVAQTDADMFMGAANYFMYSPAYIREGSGGRCPLLGAGVNCSTVPLSSAADVRKDSFLTGRGNVLSKCPECEVNLAPESVMNAAKSGFSTSAAGSNCYDTSMQPQYTRVPASCNGLRETVTLPYALSAGVYGQGYQGLASLIDGDMLQATRTTDSMAKSYGGQCRSSYAPYVVSTMGAKGSEATHAYHMRYT